MDRPQFERLARHLTLPSHPRRGVLGLLGALLASTAAGREPAVARRSHRAVRAQGKKRKKKIVLCFNGQTIRKPKKQKKKFLKRGAVRGACPPPAQCVTEGATCAQTSDCCTADGATVACYDGLCQRMTTTYGFVAEWGSFGTGPSQFDSPQGITLDRDGNVYVAEYWDRRVQKFTSDGTFLTKWGSEGTANGQFQFPSGIAVDSDGYVYVTDYLNHRIQKFTSDGVFVNTWGSNGTGSGQFDQPSDIAVDAAGNVYVADYNNHRIQKFAPVVVPARAR
jgi:hypothetical protein